MPVNNLDEAASKIRELDSKSQEAQRKIIALAVEAGDLDKLEEHITSMAFDLLEQHEDDVDRTAAGVDVTLRTIVEPDALAGAGVTRERLREWVENAREWAMEQDVAGAADGD